MTTASRGVAGTDLVVAVAPNHAREGVDDCVVVEEGFVAEPVVARGDADGVGAAAVKAEHHGGVTEVEVATGGGFVTREKTHDTVDSGRGTFGNAAIEFRFLVSVTVLPCGAVSRSVQPGRARRVSRPSDNRLH